MSDYAIGSGSMQDMKLCKFSEIFHDISPYFYASKFYQ
jgi:hypothetical protein